MKIEILPTKIIARDDSGAVFELDAMDEFAADIKIHAWIDKKDWPDIQKAVADALEMMFPGEV